MNNIINLFIFGFILIILIIFFRDINYKKIITLVKNENYY